LRSLRISSTAAECWTTISLVRPNPRALRRTRSGKHRKTYQPALDVLDRAADPIRAEEAFRWARPIVHDRHRLLMGLVDRLEQGGRRQVPMFRAERGALLPRPDITEGDAIIGLASSGVHSNGYSLVRKVVEKTGLPWTAPAPFAADKTLGEAVLTPTRIYVKTCLSVMNQTKAVKGLAHITGGGFPDNIPRVLPKGLGARIDLTVVPVLPVFKWLAAAGKIAQDEMLRTFNCGIGMIAIAAPDKAAAVCAAFNAAGDKARVIGNVVRAAGEPRVVYDGKLDLAG
jgi:hypothetical protein